MEKTRDLNVEETLLAEIQTGRLKISGKVTQEQLVAVARQIDAAKEEIELLKLKREASIAGGVALNKEAEKYQNTLAKLLADTPTAKLNEQREAMLVLAHAYEVGTINAEQFNEAATQYLDLDKVEAVRDVVSDLANVLAHGFEDAITSAGKFSDILKAVEQDIIRIILRSEVTEPFSGWLKDVLKPANGGGGGGVPPNPFATGGGGFFDMIGKFFAGFAGPFANGGSIPAGQFGLVGEAGPEFISGPATVTPMGQGGMTVHNHFTINGPADARTQDQIAKAAARGAQRALGRNG